MPHSEVPLLEELEPRLLFSADSIVGILDSQNASLQAYDLAPAESQLLQTESNFQSSASQSSRYEIVFIDAGIDDYQQLLADLQRQQDSNHQFEVFVLDNERDGIEQITEALNGQQSIDAVHVVSHGTSGRINIGDGWLDINNLESYAEAINGWSQVFSDEADLLFYGCDLAGSDEGKALVTALSRLTGADVAASVDRTGHESLRGDWVLEYSTGDIGTDVAFNQYIQQNWGHVLDVTVDTVSTGAALSFASSTTVSHTTSGSDRLMLVGVSFGQDKLDSVSAVTYNGVNLSLVGAQDHSTVAGARVEIWSLVAPDIGTHDVVVDFSGTSHIGATIGVMTFDGVDQTAALGSFASSEGNSSSPSISVPSASRELVFGVLAVDHNADIDLLPGSGQTEHWDLWQDKATGGGTTEAGAVSVDTSWSLSLVRTWAVAGISINPANASAGGDYTISEGDSVVLDASGSSDPEGDPLTYAWDLDNDLVYGDVTGVTPTVDWGTLQTYGIDDDGSYTIGLQIDDGNGDIDATTTTVTVNNVAPTLSVTGSTTAFNGGVYTLNLSASDPGNDTISSWTINWGDGNIDTIAGNPNSAAHSYTNSGFTNNITVSATDEDNPDSYIHSDLFVGHYANDAGVYRVQGDWGNPPVEFANEGTLDKTIQPIVGPDGYLYVSGEASNNVLRYNADTGAFVDVFVTGLNAAGGLAFGPNGNLFVADYDNNSIKEYDAITKANLGDFVTSGSGGLTEPYSLAFGPNGDLFVGSYNQNTVFRYDGSTGAPVDSGHPDPVGTFIPSAQDGGLGTPEQILFGPDGNLYVADLNNNRVLRFDGDTGIFIDIFVAANANGLDMPTGLAFGSDGHLYVVDSQDGVILRFNGTDGSSIDEYVTGLDNPSHLAFAPDLQVWVNPVANTPPTADAGGSYTLSEGGSLNLDASASTDPETDPLTYQWDLSYDGVTFNADLTGITQSLNWAALQAEGIVDDGSYTIAVRANDGQGNVNIDPTTLTVINTAPTLSVTGDATVSNGLSYTLNLFASEPGADTITSWTINWGDGVIETIAGDPSSVTHTYTNTGFTNNILVSAIDEDGSWTSSDLIVGNYTVGSEDLHRFDGETGAFESIFASSGGELNRPYTQVVGPDGNIYVSGYNSDNIVRYDSSGNYLGEFVVSGNGLDGPGGLAFGSDGNLYVANYSGNNILRYDGSTGAFIDIFGSGGDLDGPSGITWGADGDLYVASWNNAKLVKFDGILGGVPTTEIASGLIKPEQIVFDGVGDLFIADGSGDDVKKWDGTTLMSYFSNPSLNFATGLAFGPDGWLYISSFNTDQILRYDGVTNEIFVSSGSGGLDSPEYLSFIPSQQVTVITTNADPVFEATGPFSIDENSSATTMVGDVDANDGNGGASDAGIAYSITTNVNPNLDANNAFSIDSSSGVISVNDPADLDFEGTTPLIITVQADDGTNQSTTDVTINLNNVNEAAVGAHRTVNTLEDTDYVFSITDFGFSDLIEGDNLLAVMITTLPDVGTLYVDTSGDGIVDVGEAVSVADTVVVADISAGRLKYKPLANENGAGYSSFTFQVQDDGGTANGGVDLNQTPNTITLDIIAANDAPVATTNAVTTNEDIAYTFGVGDFTYTDVENNSLVSVSITNLNLAGGSLEHSGGISVTNGMTLSIVQIVTLRYTPAASANGTPLATFDFTVNDSGFGVTAAQMRINVTAVNSQLTATNLNQTRLYTEDNPGVTLDDIIITDVDAGEIVTATLTLADPAYGSLTTGSGATYNAVSGTWTITDTLVNVNSALANVAFIPATNNNQNTSIAITIADSGENLTVPVTGTIALTVLPVNDAPAGADATVTGIESTHYVFNALDFGFTDAIDGDNFLVVEMVTLPTPVAGSLQVNGVGAVAGQFVSVADISAGNLVFSPLAGLNGAGVASLTFRVQDDGGTVNGGVDRDPVANTITIDITAVDDTPTTSGLANITVDEDAPDTVIDLFAVFADVEDADNALVYAIVLNTSPALFATTAIDIATGSLTLDYAADQSGSTDITVRATDTTGLFVESTFTVTVNPINDTPTTSGINTVNVNEDAPVSVIDLFTAFDDIETVNSALIYAITNNTNSALFSSTTIDIGSGTLALYFASNQNGMADITVRATDTDGGFIETLFTVTITAVNDAPTAISISSNQIHNTTDTSAGSTIGTLSSEDIDVSDTANYGIVSGADAGKFSIGGSKGQLLILSDDVLDIATQSSYEVVVRVTDSGGLSHDENITVIVLDTNTSNEFIQPVETTQAIPVVALNPATEEPQSGTGQDDTVNPLASPEPGYQIGGGSRAPAPPGEEVADADQAHKEEELSAKDEEKALLINSELDTESRQIETIEKMVTSQQTLQPATENNVQARKVNDEFVYATINLNALDKAVNLESFINTMDELREDSEKSTLLQQNIVASSMVLTTGFSAGYIIWLVRGGVLLSSLLSSLPAWRFIDPMPILAASNGDDDEDTETLQSMIEDGGKIVEEKRLAQGNSEPDQAIAPEKDTE